MLYQTKSMIYQLCAKPLNFTQIRIVERIMFSTVHLNKPLWHTIFINLVDTRLAQPLLAASLLTASRKGFVQWKIYCAKNSLSRYYISSEKGIAQWKFCCAVFYIEVLMLLRWWILHPISTTANYLFLLYILATPRGKKYFFFFSDLSEKKETKKNLCLPVCKHNLQQLL